MNDVYSPLNFMYDSDKPLFSSELSAAENADRLLDLDELTLVMCTNLINEEAAERIDRAQNLYWQSQNHVDRTDPPF
ncbi:hypothetical protein SAMN05660657_05690 [Geodermatophilus amargosae]|uniref:Uncharacterized protein n=1 Tax=Geodermatophilus amargosae TaxID=1296565 RepID=A0A1I7DEV6_9ACTN|nr:hypothetical protein [Geodermatophilus amargosae]SFU10137.1 hypothetical protein SAMN05660657_05690 [Geodermatophilus amargosae]